MRAQRVCITGNLKLWMSFQSSAQCAGCQRYGFFTAELTPYTLVTPQPVSPGCRYHGQDSKRMRDAHEEQTMTTERKVAGVYRGAPLHWVGRRIAIRRWTIMSVASGHIRIAVSRP